MLPNVAECELDAPVLPVLPVAYGMRLLQQITRAAPEAFYQCVCVYEMRADGRDVSLHTTRWQCLKASSKEEQVGVTRCARENEIN